MPYSATSTTTNAALNGSSLPPAGGNSLPGFTMGDGSGGGGAGRGGKAPLPHIDDLLATKVDIDMQLPVRKILEKGDNYMRQAETFKDFKRPDLALQEYLRAYIIAVQKIPNHREWVAVQRERGDLGRIYNALVKKISLQQDAFEKIKADIKADNQRTGVRPTVSEASNGPASKPVESQPKAMARPGGQAISFPSAPTTLPGSQANGAARVGSSPVSKPRPPPPPPMKPHALHGNAISHPIGSTNTAVQDLSTRFANLRRPGSSQGPPSSALPPIPQQDARIKTHPHPMMPPQHPAGPRPMPPPPKPSVPLDTSLPSLPKLPDAIYSPARGTVTNEAAKLPSSTTRGLFTRTGSSTSLNIASTPSQSFSTSDYFAPQRFTGSPAVQAPSNVTVPEGNTITAEELKDLMQALQVLIIDVRSRESFDEGHIMSQSTICIEPFILERQDLSADDIAASMGLSPEREQTYFEQRCQFGLVVFYDQNSKELSPTSMVNGASSQSSTAALRSLHRALAELSYQKELKHPPKLLVGGIDAWKDLMGEFSLQTSATAGPSTVPLVPKSRSMVNRPRKYRVGSLKPEEVPIWEEKLNSLNMELEKSPSFVRTQEEFLRRYPSIGHESMSSPESSVPSSRVTSQVSDYYPDLPSAPTRPAPAVPRPSYSGLAQTEDDHDPTPEASQRGKLKKTPGAPQEPKHWTGLYNPGNWCYANSSVQILRASPGFGLELSDLSDKGWLDAYKVPRKGNEKGDPPQLMTKMISNLVHWMSTGKFPTMKIEYLMKYSQAICRKSNQGQSRMSTSDAEFGGPQQQDAEEFLTFLFDNLHDETNMQRNVPGVAEAGFKLTDKSVLQATYNYWLSRSKYDNSMIDRYWEGLDLATTTCLACRTTTCRFQAFHVLKVHPIGGRRQYHLRDLLEAYTAPEILEDFQCDTCRAKQRAERRTYLARLPKLLCIQIVRFRVTDSGYMAKIAQRIQWDFNRLSLDEYFYRDRPESRGGLPEGGAAMPEDERRAFVGPHRYECYGVIMHAGETLHRGHYYCYVRDPTATRGSHEWYRCSDTQVGRVTIASGGAHDVDERVFKHNDNVPYLLFFRRAGPEEYAPLERQQSWKT